MRMGDRLAGRSRLAAGGAEHGGDGAAAVEAHERRRAAVIHVACWAVAYATAVLGWPGGSPSLGVALLVGAIFLATKGALLFASRRDDPDAGTLPLPVSSAAAQLVGAMLLAAALAVVNVPGLPPGMALLDGMLSLALLAVVGATGHAVARRLAAERSPRLALLGRPDALARAMAGGAALSGGRVVALVVDGPTPGMEAGASLRGVPIVEVSELERMLLARSIDRVSLLSPLTPSLCAWVGARCRDAGIPSGIGGALPPSLAALTEALAGTPEVLLGRPALAGRPERERLVAGAIAGRCVLITGAGGALGAELAREVVKHAPVHLMLADGAEAGLVHLERELTARAACAVSIHPLDVRDPAAAHRLLAAQRPDVVFHIDAHRQIPLAEREPSATVLANLAGARALADAALASGAERFVLAGSLASVHPTSVLGATCRLAELCVRTAASSRGTRMAVVRLPGLLGAEGSVVPLWIDELRRGLPLSITEPDAERHFLTLGEAARALVEAAALSEPGEALVPDAGPPVKVVELAGRVLALAGLRPGADVPLCRVGLRPGERMQEQLSWPEEQVRAGGAFTRSQGDGQALSLWSVRGPLPEARAVNALIDPLVEAARAGHEVRVVRALMSAVPGYRASDAQERLAAESGTPRGAGLVLDDGGDPGTPAAPPPVPSVVVVAGMGGNP